jgi:hypothetical protein
MELYELVQQKGWFVARRDGAVRGAIGQAHLSVPDLLKAIKSKAIFKLATTLEALTMPWVRADARAPWADAVDARSQQVGSPSGELRNAPNDSGEHRHGEHDADPSD